jgi:hypothetical protein
LTFDVLENAENFHPTQCLHTGFHSFPRFSPTGCPIPLILNTLLETMVSSRDFLDHWEHIGMFNTSTRWMFPHNSPIHSSTLQILGKYRCLRSLTEKQLILPKTPRGRGSRLSTFEWQPQTCCSRCTCLSAAACPRTPRTQKKSGRPLVINTGNGKVNLFVHHNIYIYILLIIITTIIMCIYIYILTNTNRYKQYSNGI